jgi:(p)ppGpp synthase/HD superfamily hydrolase
LNALMDTIEESGNKMVDTNLIQKALRFATESHASINHKRKYTGEDYIVHPIEVAELVKKYGGSNIQQAAALLHDTVEDTPVTIMDIQREFGPEVADLVADLTDISKPEDGNRKFRKDMDRQHTAMASADAQVVKLADLVSNSISIKQHDSQFWKVYQQEKIALLNVMDKVSNHPLYSLAQGQVKDV